MNSDYAFIAHIAFLLLATSYLIRDVLYLRIIAVVAAWFMIAFNIYSYPQPIWVVIGWNVAFITINVGHVAWLIHDRRRGNLSDREEQLRTAVFPMLKPSEFRKLMQVANWADFEQGQILVSQGDGSSRPLLYLYSGVATVEVDERVVARISDGAFIGEMGYLTAAPATATVRALQAGSVVRWPSASLNALLQKEASLRFSMQQVLAHDVVTKLARHARVSA